MKLRLPLYFSKEMSPGSEGLDEGGVGSLEGLIDGDIVPVEPGFCLFVPVVGDEEAVVEVLTGEVGEYLVEYFGREWAACGHSFWKEFFFFLARVGMKVRMEMRKREGGMRRTTRGVVVWWEVNSLCPFYRIIREKKREGA